MGFGVMLVLEFQHTAARRRLRVDYESFILALEVSTHSRAEAAAQRRCVECMAKRVSTHSRAEAAAEREFVRHTQKAAFQHTAARRRLHPLTGHLYQQTSVSTHSRAEAAACVGELYCPV